MMKINRDNYAELSKGKSVPYCFEIKKGKQMLFYFGANHSRYMKNRQYTVLRKYWNKFVNTKSTTKLLVVEGQLRQLNTSEKKAAENGSEGSVVTIWANKEGISIICPEPSRNKIDDILRKKFPEEQILYYHFAGLVDSWRRHSPKPDFNAWTKDVMTTYSRRFDWKEFDLPHMKALHKKLFGKTFSLKEIAFFNNISNPNRTETVINQVARASSDIRDTEILKRLKKEWESGKSLFVVYGSGHAFLHEPILKTELLTPKRRRKDSNLRDP